MNTSNVLAVNFRRNLIQAQGDDKKRMNMSVLTDANGHKVAQKLYHQYISDSDYSKLPAFVQALDALLSHFGAGQQQDEGTDEDEQVDKPVKPEKPDKTKSDNRDKF